MTLTFPSSIVPNPPESVIAGTGSSSETMLPFNPQASKPQEVLTTTTVTASTETVPVPLATEEFFALKPYAFEDSEKAPLPPPDVKQVWIEVGNGIDKSQTVIWKSAVESLDYANKYLNFSSDARHFVDTYTGPIIGILVEQQPAKIGTHERNCVQDSLALASMLTARDLSIQLRRGVLAECLLLNTTLHHIFNKKKAFYKGNKGTWNVNHHLAGLPEVRLRNIERFRGEGGFRLLAQYLEEKVKYQEYYIHRMKEEENQNPPTPFPPSLIPPSNLFPKLDPLHQILQALCDTINSRSPAITTSALSGPSNQTVITGEIPPPPNEKNKEEDAIAVAQVVMKYIHNTSESELKKIPTDQLSTIVQHDLQRIFDRLISTRRECTYQFYTFWRALVLKLISSKSLPLKLFGWEQVGELIDACADHAPPPRQYLVKGAGCTFANGLYYYAGAVTQDGYAKHGADVLYTRTIPPSEVSTISSSALPRDGSDVPTSVFSDDNNVVPATQSSVGGLPGKKLTLFRCTMRSQQKWWFLSEADEDQPGTDRDIDYYQHKSKEHEEAHPPSTGWITCRSAGVNPPPTLEPQGLMVPLGKEYDTLEHQLAKWAIENEIVEGVLGDSTIHREVVARSTVLMKFLASMCSRDDGVSQAPSQPPHNRSSDNSPTQRSCDEMTTDENASRSSASSSPITAGVAAQTPNQFCLQPSHLLFAWKTCTRKADAAVSLQVYQLLVQILPSCPSSVAIPLLKAVQASLVERSVGSEKNDYLNEVAEFCSALAHANLADNSASTNKNSQGQATSTSGVGGSSLTGTPALKEDVREEVLNLLWSVLRDPGASALKSYDSIKRYVTHELRVEPGGSEHRERFLHSCIVVMSDIAGKQIRGSIDETQALRMVKLTRFVLEACPRQQAELLVTRDNGKLPELLYNELKAYLNRRVGLIVGLGGSVQRKIPQIASSSHSLVSAPPGGVPDSKQQHAMAFDERLRILRFVYGLSSLDTSTAMATSVINSDAHFVIKNTANTDENLTTMSLPMLEDLWKLCDSPDDREALMFFIASASYSSKAASYEPSIGVVSSVNLIGTITEQYSDHLLTSSFTEEVCQAVFLNLFCSLDFKYDQLGESGYRSFQFLFRKLRDSPSAKAEIKKTSLDALWRISLTATQDTVVSQAMKDLLSVYVALQQLVESNRNSVAEDAAERMVTDDSSEENFVERIYNYLDEVKHNLDFQIPGAELSAGRCMRILNAAIGQQVESGIIDGLTTSSTLARMSLLHPNSATIDDVLKCLPHGLRGQASYRRVGFIAKRSQAQNNSQTYETSSNNRLPSIVKFTLDVHPLETLISIKFKVASYCRCNVSAVKPIQINGRARGSSGNDLSHLSLNVVHDDSVMDELGVVQGCEFVFVIAERPIQSNTSSSPTSGTTVNTTARTSFMANDLSSLFFCNDGKFSDKLFTMVLSIIEALPWTANEVCKRMIDVDSTNMNELHSGDSLSSSAYKLAWDLLLAMPTNTSVASRVKLAQRGSFGGDSTSISSEDAMEVEICVDGTTSESWGQVLDASNFDRSVYVLLTIDAFLQPAPEALSTLQPTSYRQQMETKLVDDAIDFRRSFLDVGGFNAVVRFFAASGNEKDNFKQIKTRRGNAVALRILKSCLFGTIYRDPSNSSNIEMCIDSTNHPPDETGSQLLQSLSDVDGLLKSLTNMVVDDMGISSGTISDVLRFLRLLFRSQNAASIFIALPNAERFLVILLMWEDARDVRVRTSSSINAAMLVRRGVHDLILQTRVVSDRSLPWLIHAINNVDVSMESTVEYFDVLERLLSSGDSVPSFELLKELGIIVCKKLLSCPRPGNETDLVDFPTGVLCGCMKLLRALIEHGGSGQILQEGANILLQELDCAKWSGELLLKAWKNQSGSNAAVSADDKALLDLMGVVFDGFLSPGGIAESSSSSSVPICCEKESRRRGFEVIGTAARRCKSEAGYITLVGRINGVIESAAPRICHRWGQLSSNGNDENAHSRTRSVGLSKYSGLRNQGCTCYMNSVLQQLIMMPGLRDSMCSAPLPATLRTVGSGISAKSAELVGKKISLQWETGVSYDALVESFNELTGMHRIVYLPIQIATVGGVHQQHVHPEDIFVLPSTLPDEFILTDGRPGKETGVFEVLTDQLAEMDVREETKQPGSGYVIKETEDEASSRRLLEEFQRTFTHLKVGSKGRCFDPRALVEACSCLKLEFDVWQQNDASEFATKLLDRLEISLKRWAPQHFRYMDHTFGVKQTKQKVCRKCGLKTNREEKLLNIDCQIRGKSDIHEALSAMTEVEIMEGSNRVYCDNCKENTDTILKSAISTLPNVLILSLKRFDLDFTTFETVKLNSRCAFGQSLNMKRYTLEGLEVLERAAKERETVDPKPMDTEDGITVNEDPLRVLPDEDFEYRLVGVLVHAGVAQGGHYYSFIKDRNPGSEDKWFRFDDEDVTPFDPALIETECFGGKVKKEAKWPNGQVHTVEQEQFANALMLFYEKVKQTDLEKEQSESPVELDPELQSLATTSGYDVFEPDVLKANATYQRQSFLFDSEFQLFLKNMLGHCRNISKSERDVYNHESGNPSWRVTVIQMLLSYVFDVLLYSSDTSDFADWSRMLEEVLMQDLESSISFVHMMAQKTRLVSANWIRTYLLECPDHLIRSSAAHVFSAAIRACITSNGEINALEMWTQGWKEQMAEFEINAKAGRTGVKAAPCTLAAQWCVLEDVQRLGSGAASLGIIISYLNVLLEAMPRCWRFSCELCLFIRFLASMANNNGEHVLRRPMIEAQIPARIIALIIRERLPATLREIFPGASVAPEVAHTQIRAESSSHGLQMSGNQVVNSDLNGSRGRGTSDLSVLLEALCCFASLPGVVHANLVRDTEDVMRGRQRYVLSENAMKALSTVFQECCVPGNPGMGQRDIESYLRRCKVDTGAASSQKILDMLSKYPTTTSNDQKGAIYLSLDGFLAYYRDCVQSNDIQLRLDLHTFGFRPDLSRRSREARFFLLGERETLRCAAESVACDVAETFGENSVDIGVYANHALANSVHLFTTAHSVSEPLMEYLAAGAVYRRNIHHLVNRTLLTIYSTPTDWDGNEMVTGLTTLLQVIASTPGNDQQDRIGDIMLAKTKAARNVDFNAGLLQALRGLHRLRQSHNYNHDIGFSFGRYMHILKELQDSYPIVKWMKEHPSQWDFIERDLTESRHPVPNHSHGRNDYGPRSNNDITLSADHNAHSDSDAAGMNDSEDDEDSQFDAVDNLEVGPSVSMNVDESPNELIVEGAGNPAVNGTYTRDGHFENACRYIREGAWNGSQHKFLIFLCNVSNNTKHWYISIVPPGGTPGISSDIDFYTAPVTPASKFFAPTGGWVSAQEGEDPPPRIRFVGDDDDEEVEDVEDESGSPLGYGHGAVVEDDSKFV